MITTVSLVNICHHTYLQSFYLVVRTFKIYPHSNFEICNTVQFYYSFHLVFVSKLSTEFYAAERKKELIPFATAWMELESIMLSEISQVVCNKYHMISPLTGTKSTEEKSKQNITRDIEVKNNLTIARGEGEGTVRRRVFRNYYKEHMDKTKREGGSRGRRWVWLGWVWLGWGENADNCN